MFLGRRREHKEHSLRFLVIRALVVVALVLAALLLLEHYGLLVREVDTPDSQLWQWVGAHL